MKEWDPKEAQLMIQNILQEETEEDKLSDEECERLAAIIIAHLEGIEG